MRGYVYDIEETMNISEMRPMSNIQVMGVQKGHPKINELMKDKVHVSYSKEIKPFFLTSAGYSFSFLLGLMGGEHFFKLERSL